MGNASAGNKNKQGTGHLHPTEIDTTEAVFD